MKKIVAMLAILAFGLTACDSGKSFKLTANGLPEELNGKFAYIEDQENTLVDSIAINNGSLKYEKKEPFPSGLHILLIGEGYSTFYFEEGSFTIAQNPDSDNASNLYLFSGAPTSMTMAFQNFNSEVTTAVASFQQKLADLNNSARDGEFTEEQIAEATEAYNGIYATVNEVARRYYEQFKDQPIAPFFFTQLQFDSNEAFIAEYEAASDYVKSDDGLKQRYEILQKEAETGVGKPFVDYELNDGAGTTKNLSDFRTEGNYLLLDFFASWCGPCKRTMPHLAELHKKLGKKGLTIASVAIWERGETPREDYQNAVKEWNITWNHFYDSESKGAEVYAISGVPTMFLVSPEGTILVRTHNPQDIDDKLTELGLL